MNGREHYAEAERLLKVADSPAGAALRADGYDLTAAAQVHATLALFDSLREVGDQLDTLPRRHHIGQAAAQAVSKGARR